MIPAIADATEPGFINIIERLPEELRLWVFAYLEFEDALYLSQTSRFFHLSIQPLDWPDIDKDLFVADAQNWSKHNQCVADRATRSNEIRTATNGYACFRCYRVLPRRNFSRSKTERLYAKSILACFERYCLDCGMRDSMYPPGTILERITCEGWDMKHRRVQIIENFDRLLVCKLCNTLGKYDELRPPGRCRVCISTTYINTLPGARSEITQRGMLTVRCWACSGVQDAREPATTHIDCKWCLKVWAWSMMLLFFEILMIIRNLESFAKG